MVDIHYEQSGVFLKAVASSPGKDSTGSYVRQRLLFEQAAGGIVTFQCGVSYGSSQCRNPLAGSDKIIHFAELHCFERYQCGFFQAFSGHFVLDR